MFPSPSYPSVAPEAIDAFVAEQFCGKLIAIDRDGFTCVSLLPFIRNGECIEVHMVQEDPTFEALCENPRAGFLIDEPLAFTPHDVISELDAGMATLHFRAVHFRVHAEVSTDPNQVAVALERLLAAYQPDAVWTPVVDGPQYGPRLRRLAVAHLNIVAVEAKFKVAQNRTPAQRVRLCAYLAQRDLPGDRLAISRLKSVAAEPSGSVAAGDPPV